MSVLDKISKFLGTGVRQSVRCGARVPARDGTSNLVQCRNVFEIPPGAVVPDIPICPICERRFNEGIVQGVHAHTGRLTGGYNIFDKLL